ncbi:MAG: cytochrome c [Proteobacteria bacterium]|nr:cytochrome c [Pseudomonadota bacterium]
MKKLTRLTAIAICFTCFSSLGSADSGVQDLSPELRSLLSKEMLSLQEGMQSILPAYVSGDLDEVAKIARKIKNSYILKQQITDTQKRELKSKLPASFLQSDQKFHEYAGMLEHVSKEKHMELVGFYYAKLSESCVSCHSQHASHRFKAFNKEQPQDNGHH